MIPRPFLPVNVLAHIIVGALQHAPDGTMTKPELKALARKHTACTKPLFEDACDKVTRLGYADRIPVRESGAATAVLRLTASGRLAKVWTPPHG